MPYNEFRRKDRVLVVKKQISNSVNPNHIDRSYAVADYFTLP